MKKILNATFQIFLCSISTHHNLKISCILNMERIFNDWHVLHEKRLKKDYMKIKSQKHQCKGFLAWIFTLIHSSYKHKPKPNAKNLEAAPQIKYTLCIFCQKVQN